MLDATMRLVHATWGVVLATFLLVVATAGLLQDSWRKRNEERDRWKREDALRVEENKPKAVFELDQVETDRESITLWCANLGTVSFIVSGMTIEPVRDSEKLISLPQLKQYVFTAGTERAVDLDLEPESFGEYHGNVAVRLHLRGPSEDVVTDAYPHWLSVFDGKRNGLRPGFQGLEHIVCSKCKEWAANFRAEGIISMADLRKQIADVEREFETICPKHNSSKNSRVTFGELADVM